MSGLVSGPVSEWDNENKTKDSEKSDSEKRWQGWSKLVRAGKRWQGWSPSCKSRLLYAVHNAVGGTPTPDKR